MSSKNKKGWPLQQVDDPGGGVAVVTPDQTSGDDVGLLDTVPTKKKTRASGKTKVSDKEFVAKWLSCDSYCVMSFNTDMTISAVQARATRLRKAGVKLPLFTRSARKPKETDVTSLNNMIEASISTKTAKETTYE